ncbi:MAG: hypothetical protein AAFU79_21200 [Myxococcota bacterium]
MVTFPMALFGVSTAVRSGLAAVRFAVTGFSVVLCLGSVLGFRAVSAAPRSALLVLDRRRSLMTTTMVPLPAPAHEGDHEGQEQGRHADTPEDLWIPVPRGVSVNLGLDVGRNRFRSPAHYLLHPRA